MLTACLALALVSAAAPPDTVVVCPPALRPALAPWLELRTSQGHECLVIGNESADVIRREIRAAAAGQALRYVVLVGDAPAGGKAVRGAPTVPTHYLPSQVIHRFGGEKNIAGDNWYADLDDDNLPDVAIGRITADSPADLQVMVNKIVAYERGPGQGAWRRRISLVAGLAGFGQIADATIEACAKKLLIEGVPPAYDTTVTYGSWRSPYCPDPKQFHAATVDRFNEGCLFWVYIGHGHVRTVDQLRMPDGRHHIFNTNDCEKLRCADRSPIALMLCCSSGGYDQADDCLAEEFLRAEQGPVAAFAGSRVTMPYAMSVLGAEMLRSFFQDNCATTGELLLSAKRAMMLRPRDDANSQSIDALAKLLNPASTDLEVERAEHLQLFNLIGDPLLKLPRGAAAQVAAPAQARPGESITVSGTSPVEGDVAVELVVRRDRLAFRRPSRYRYETTDAAREEFQETYRRANDARLTTETTKTSSGAYQVRLTVPSTASGACHVRVFVQGADDVAVGAADIAITASAGEE